MAHFAKLDENNIVVNVVVVANNSLDPNNEEASGAEFLNNLYNTQDNWKQTSYNGNIRFNYAGIGFIYDEVRDAFIAPEPDSHLGFDEKTCRWILPKPHYET
jgi:hypothetical protein